MFVFSLGLSIDWGGVFVVVALLLGICMCKVTFRVLISIFYSVVWFTNEEYSEVWKGYGMWCWL